MNNFVNFVIQNSPLTLMEFCIIILYYLIIQAKKERKKERKGATA